MEPVTSGVLLEFLRRLGDLFPHAGVVYLLGGSALCLLGNSRVTQDVDYTYELETGVTLAFERAVAELAAEMHLDLESVPLGEFIPLPPQARERRRPIGRFGQLDMYIFDPYSIALSKIARGFEADLEDVVFMLNTDLIEFAELERLFNAVLPDAPKADIDRREFKAYFEEIRRRAE